MPDNRLTKKWQNFPQEVDEKFLLLFDTKEFYRNYFIRSGLDLYQNQIKKEPIITNMEIWHKLDGNQQVHAQICEVFINRDDSFREIHTKFQQIIRLFHSYGIPFRLTFHIKDNKLKMFISLIEPFYMIGNIPTNKKDILENALNTSFPQSKINYDEWDESIINKYESSATITGIPDNIFPEELLDKSISYRPGLETLHTFWSLFYNIKDIDSTFCIDFHPIPTPALSKQLNDLMDIYGIILSKEKVNISKSESKSHTRGTIDRDFEKKLLDFKSETMSGFSGYAFGAGLLLTIAGAAAGGIGAVIGGSIAIGGPLLLKIAGLRYKYKSLKYPDMKIDQTTTTQTEGKSYSIYNGSAAIVKDYIKQAFERNQKLLRNGAWYTNSFILTNSDKEMKYLANSIASSLSGYKKHHLEPMRVLMPVNEFEKECLKGYALCGHPIQLGSDLGLCGVTPGLMGNIVGSEEVAQSFAFPTYDLPGLKIRRRARYTQNIFEFDKDKNKEKYYIEHGIMANSIMQESFKLPLSIFTGHGAFFGETESGKTVSAINILKKIFDKSQNIDFKGFNNNLSFVIINPLTLNKEEISEFMELDNNLKYIDYSDVTKNNRTEHSLFFNPLKRPMMAENKFDEDNHISLIKNTFNMSFPMYASMPYIIEDCIEQMFTDYKEKKDYISFGLFSKILEEKIHNDEWQGEARNYLPALKYRINSFLKLKKGKIFNKTEEMIDNEEHLDFNLWKNNILFNLSIFSDPCDYTSFVIFLLNRIYQIATVINSDRINKRLVVVIEEAHRLLPNLETETNLESSDIQKSALKLFTQILAEWRHYGISLWVISQRASNLHPDVNALTNFKVIHRTAEMNDIETIKKSAGLSDEQAKDLSSLAVPKYNQYSETIFIDSSDNLPRIIRCKK